MNERIKNVGDTLIVEGFLRYRVTAVKHGGMGYVYLLHQDFSASVPSWSPWQSDIAAKTFCAMDDFEDRFKRELEIWIDLSITNVAPLLSITRIEGRLFAIMPQFGCSLRDVIDVHGTLPEKVAIGHVLSAASCLSEALNRRQVLHLDLKPSNLLLKRINSDHCYVSDWGIARVIHGDMHCGSSRTKTLVETAAAGGTLPYMSPERVLGLAPVAADDMYSVGLILCELITGSLPLTASSTDEIAFQIASGAYYDSAKRLLAHTAPALADLILRSIAPRRIQRYGNYLAFMIDLRRIQNGLP